jgi:polar amino acid transport system substrate-binding protein
MPPISRTTPIVTAVCAALLAAGLAAPAAADTLERVSRDGAFNLGYRTDAPPFAFRSRDGLPAGYSVELCARVADAVAATIDRDLTGGFVPVEAAQRFDRLANGDIDMLCGATTVTMTRRERFDFSLLTFITGGTLLVQAGEAAARPGQDPTAGRIGVLVDTTSEKALRELMDSGEVPGEIAVVDSHTEGVRRLRAGEIDAYFGDHVLLLGLRFNDPEPDTLAVSDRLITLEPYALAMRRGDDRLRLLVDRTLAELYRSGEIFDILERWLPGGEPSPLLQSLFLLQSIPE